MNKNPLREAMECETQGQADALIERMVAQHLRDEPTLNPESVAYTARQNIGYYAGNATHAVRERVERLFRTAHPVYGAIRYNGPPTLEQISVLGQLFGAAMREHQSTEGGHIKDAMTQVAEIPRVDPRRLDERPTGIQVRALGTDGTFGNHDLCELTCDSVVRYLHSRGGRNAFAECIVLQILGHEVPEHLRPLPRP